MFEDKAQYKWDFVLSLVLAFYFSLLSYPGLVV